MALRSLWSMCVVGFVLSCGSFPLAEGAIDSAQFDHWSVHVVTEDRDGGLRTTRIWIVEIDGVGFIRSKQSRWFANLERGSSCRIRVAGREYPVSVTAIEDLALRRRIDAAFVAKYGWQETLVIGKGRAESADPYMRLTAVGSGSAQ